jgi:hypothetical protein
MPVARKILIVGLESWPGVARLPRALQDAGFSVGVACFEENHLAATKFRDRFFPWHPGCRRGGALLRQLETVVDEWQPDFLVPADDPTVVFLARSFGRLRSGNRLASLLKFSLGNPAALLEAESKHGTFEMARRCGIRVPHCRMVSNETEMLAFAGETGFPFLLKQSFGWGGGGVAVCRNESEAIAVWGNWRRKPAWKRRFYAWRNRIRGRELGPRWSTTGGCIVASQFITGKPAMCLTTVFEGRVLAMLTAFKEKTFPNELGPSSVVRFVHNEEMRLAAEKLVGAWGLSGFVGFDFLVDSRGDAWLIECNPRPTPISHLGARLGEDICAALFCRLTGRPLPPMNRGTEMVVAHFPQEQLRDPASPYLTQAFHDMPLEDPDLMRRLALLRR